MADLNKIIPIIVMIKWFGVKLENVKFLHYCLGFNIRYLDEDHLKNVYLYFNYAYYHEKINN